MKNIFLAIILFFSSFNVWAGPQGEQGEFEKGIYEFLLNQRNRRTGALSSFINTTDEVLTNQASTYDLALAGLGFLELGDCVLAGKILSFFMSRWNSAGLANFYDTVSGEYGIEETVHLGPNMWVAVLALHYTTRTRDNSFFPLAKKIALWARKLNHYQGGISMGEVSNWGGDWPGVFSSENNIVAYTVYRSLETLENNRRLKQLFRTEAEGIRNFIDKVTIVRDREEKLLNISVGFNPEEGVSKVSACDVVNMLLLAFKPQELKDFFSLDKDVLINFAREKFLVKADGIEGFDFTDEASLADIERPRMISLEWTMQFAVSLIWLGDVEQARFFINEADKKKIKFKNMYFFPYATKDFLQVFPFAPWWRTPSGSPSVCGAMSSTMWRLFAHREFNPLNLR